jgi:hypothetical protein
MEREIIIPIFNLVNSGKSPRGDFSKQQMLVATYESVKNVDG